MKWLDTAWIALIGTLFGGVVLKVTEGILGRSSKNDDMATALRAELRTDMAALKLEIKAVEKEADEWRTKYWELRGEVMKAKEVEKLVGDPPNVIQ